MKEEIKNEITEKALLQFFLEVDSDFNPPLSERLNIEEYVKKIFSLATLFSEFSADGYLMGVVAIYLYDSSSENAFVPFVAVRTIDRGKGIAKRILSKAIDAARLKGKKKVGIATNNPIALHLYENLGFKRIDGEYDDIRHPQLILDL